jgi:hypothetical protein
MCYLVLERLVKTNMAVHVISRRWRLSLVTEDLNRIFEKNKSVSQCVATPSETFFREEAVLGPKANDCGRYRL